MVQIKNAITQDAQNMAQGTPTPRYRESPDNF